MVNQRINELMEILAEIDETFGEWWDLEGWDTPEDELECLEEWLEEIT